MRTQVAIVGAGPAGLLLGALLHRAGIDNVVLEQRSADYVLGRIRAGVLEQVAVDLLREAGVAARMDAQGLPHRGFEMAFGERRLRIDLHALTGKQVMVYGQTEVTRDLMDHRRDSGRTTVYEAEDVQPHGFDGDHPWRRATATAAPRSASTPTSSSAATASTASAAPAVPAAALQTFEKVYPFGWLGLLADTPPVNEELIYGHTERGFMLASMRSHHAQPLLPAVLAGRQGGAVVRRGLLGRVAPPPAGRGRRAAGDRAVDREEHRAAAQLRRRAACASAACSWPATRRTSCRPPAPRG